MAFDINASRARATRAISSFSPQQLFILGGLVIVSLIGLVALLRWVSQPSYVVLASGTSAADTGEVAAALDGAGIAYKLSGNGTGVMVTQTDIGPAKLALSDAGVSASGGVQGYEILDEQAFTTSDFQQQINRQRALEGELTRTLMDLDGVDSARVQLSLPERALFTDDQEAARASVLLGANRPLDAGAVQAVMQTVASAVPDLSPDNVTVTDTSGRILSVDGLAAGSDPTQLARKYEAVMAAQAESMLAAMYGPGRAVVRVSADMNFDEVERKNVTYEPESKVAVAESTVEEAYTGTDGPVPEGVIGVTGATLGAAEGAKQIYNKSENTVSAAVNSEEQVTRVNPGTIKRLSVAVALDETVQPDAAMVTSLIGAAVGLDPARGDLLEVGTTTFDTASADAAEAALKEAAGAESKDKILGYARTGGAILVLLLAVLFLRKGLKSRRTSIDEIDEATLARSAQAHALAAPEPMALATGRVAAGRSDERELAPVERSALDPAAEVLDLIDREPEDVAALLRSWVADRRS